MAMRKMLEVTKGERTGNTRTALVFLYSSEKEAWEMQGMADVDIENEKGIWIHFISHMLWEMKWHNERIIRSKNMLLEFPLDLLETQFYSKINAMAENIQTENLWNIVEAAGKQQHGTILIIFNNEENFIINEVKRLEQESSGNRLEKPVLLDDKLVLQISAIDGAVIMDTKGRVYGFGFILDSFVKMKGEISRGARYNSSRKYIASLVNRETEEIVKALAVIISEDGMMDFYSTEDYRRNI